MNALSNLLRHVSTPFLVCLILLSSCSGQNKNNECFGGRDSKMDTLITDGIGRKIKVPRLPKRMIGLAPSSTEMLYFLFDTSQIVGRSHVCNYPLQIKSKPTVNTYPLDLEQLIALKPDLTVTVDGMLSRSDIDRIEQEGIPVYIQRFEKISDIIKDMQKLADLTNRRQQTALRIDSLEKEIKILEEEAKSRKLKPKVLAMISSDPIYVFGKNSFLGDAIRLAGGQNAVDEAFGSAYPAVSVEYLLKINPDIIIGLSFEQADSSFFKLYPTLKRINAYRNKNIFDVDDDLMTRPGPRFLQAIHELKKIIQK